MWQEHVMDKPSPIEFADLVDLDNDGKKDEVLPEFGDESAPLAWYERDHHGGMVKRIASPRSYGHGIGRGTSMATVATTYSLRMGGWKRRWTLEPPIGNFTRNGSWAQWDLCTLPM